MHYISSSKSLNCFLNFYVSFCSALRYNSCWFKSCLTNSSSSMTSLSVYYCVWFFELKLLGYFELPTISAHRFWSSTRLMIFEFMKYYCAAKHLIVRQIRSLDSRLSVFNSSLFSKYCWTSLLSDDWLLMKFFDIWATKSMAVPVFPVVSESLYSKLNFLVSKWCISICG